MEAMTAELEYRGLLTYLAYTCISRISMNR